MTKINPFPPHNPDLYTPPRRLKKLRGYSRLKKIIDGLATNITVDHCDHMHPDELHDNFNMSMSENWQVRLLLLKGLCKAYQTAPRKDSVGYFICISLYNTASDCLCWVPGARPSFVECQPVSLPTLEQYVSEYTGCKVSLCKDTFNVYITLEA